MQQALIGVGVDVLALALGDALSPELGAEGAPVGRAGGLAFIAAAEWEARRVPVTTLGFRCPTDARWGGSPRSAAAEIADLPSDHPIANSPVWGGTDASLAATFEPVFDDVLRRRT